MSLIVILMSGALGGYMAPALVGRLSVSWPMNVLFGMLGGLLGGLGFLIMFQPNQSFDGLLLLIASSFVYGVLMVIAAALVRNLLRTR